MERILVVYLRRADCESKRDRYAEKLARFIETLALPKAA